MTADPAVVAPSAAPVDPAIAARRAATQARTDAVRAQFRHDLNVAYGDQPLQVMDVYYPQASSATAAPLLVWVHGGGFRRGSPANDGYNGGPYLERGSVFVSMGYRLASAVRFPDTCADIELGLRWLVEHIAERGGDPTRVYLAGHSAGAMLAAAVGFHLELIRGLVLISGFYDLSNQSDEIVNRASPRYARNLIEAIERVPEHTIVIAADNDSPAALPNARALFNALQARGASVEMFVEPDADHLAANRSFATPGSNVAQAVERMMSLG